MHISRARLTRFIRLPDRIFTHVAQHEIQRRFTREFISPFFFPFLKPLTVARHSSHRPFGPIFRLPHPIPRHRMSSRARTRTPTMSFTQKSARPSRAKQLFRFVVQFLRHVFCSVVVPDRAFGQRVHCGYVSSLPPDKRPLKRKLQRRSAFTSG